jgi:hypothetical protein
LLSLRPKSANTIVFACDSGKMAQLVNQRRVVDQKLVATTSKSTERLTATTTLIELRTTSRMPSTSTRLKAMR